MRIRNLVYYFLASVCLLAFLVPATCLGQGFEATITGIITDTTGAILPGVEITATNQETNMQSTALSGDAGYYTIVGLSPGLYRVEAEMPGFKKYVQSDIRLGVNQVGRIDIELEIGLITEEVQVVGEAPILNTESAEKGSVIYNEEIADFPLEGREFYELAFLTVGVIPEQEGGQGGRFSVNGTRVDSMNYVVDGGNNNILRGGDAVVRPSLDSVQEFKVQTSNYSSQYGRRSTGVINLVLKSGTNAYHGLLFNFHRNSGLDAANFFDPIRYTDSAGNITTDLSEGSTYLDKDKSVLIRNNYGGNIGGPIVRDKMFFFFNFEGMRRREGQTRFGSVPTDEMLQGIFPGKIRNPFSSKCKAGKKWTKCPFFKNNTVPPELWHPTSVQLLESIPAPNTGRTAGNFISNKVDADDWEDYTAKFDWHLGEADTLSARYILNERWQDQPFNGSIYPGFGAAGPQRFQLFGITLTHTFSPNVINQTLLNFSRKHNDRRSHNAGTDFCEIFGIEGCTKDPDFVGFPRIDFNEIEDFGDANNRPLIWTENDYNFLNTLTIIKGQHSLTLGGEVVRTQFYQLHQQRSRGQFNFRSHRKGKKDGRRTGDQFADFLLGMMDISRVRVKPMTNYLFSTSFAGFFQDDWKVTPNLTVNLGLRYDLFIPPNDKFNRWANFDPSINKLVISGEPGSVEILPEQEDFIVFGGSDYPKSLIYSDRNNFAPRVGLAWRPFSSRTVIRAGFGQFFGMSILNPIRSSLGVNPPFSILEIHRRNNKDPFHLTWDTPFPAVNDFDDIENPSGYELRPPTANLYQYNLTVEQQFGQSLVAELAYVGSKGTHLGRRYNINQWSFTTGSCEGLPDSSCVEGPDGVIAQRPIRVATGQTFGNIQFYSFEADSNYHAFQASLRKRGRGTTFRLNYSLSKSIDDASRLSGGGGNNQQTFPGVQDLYNRDAERALSDFDRRHAFTGSVLYKLPFRNHFLARGWQLNSIVRLYSGTPISPRDGGADVEDGESPRPDRIGTGSLDNPSADMWFNIADFPLVEEGSFRYGDAGRNVVRGPGRKRWSFSVMRNFRMPAEGHRLQFRWEIFNIPNFVNLRRIEERLDRNFVGTAERAYPARQMQVALKYMF